MSVMITLPLFGRPGQELNEGEEVTDRQLRGLGDDLRNRLREAADVVEQLTAAGWEPQMALYDVVLSHPSISTSAQAHDELEDLGIDPEGLSIEEWDDEENEVEQAG
jgi:hypothetical protein